MYCNVDCRIRRGNVLYSTNGITERRGIKTRKEPEFLGSAAFSEGMNCIQTHRHMQPQCVPLLASSRLMYSKVLWLSINILSI